MGGAEFVCLWQLRWRPVCVRSGHGHDDDDDGDVTHRLSHSQPAVGIRSVYNRKPIVVCGRSLLLFCGAALRRTARRMWHKRHRNRGYRYPARVKTIETRPLVFAISMASLTCHHHRHHRCDSRHPPKPRHQMSSCFSFFFHSKKKRGRAEETATRNVFNSLPVRRLFRAGWLSRNAFFFALVFCVSFCVYFSFRSKTQ